jgi:hypothetical protein
MKVKLVVPDRYPIVIPTPPDGAASVSAPIACSACGADAPIEVSGCGITSHDHDTYYADAAHVGCGKVIGRLSAKVETLFGIEEDEAVCARARVYR